MMMVIESLLLGDSSGLNQGLGLVDSHKDFCPSGVHNVRPRCVLCLLLYLEYLFVIFVPLLHFIPGTEYKIM